MDVLLATKNLGKIAEFRTLLEGLPIRLIGLDEFPHIPDVEETGKSFTENAALKAKTYAKHTGLCALADDSGLEVLALGGAPGIYSARYAGAFSTNEEKITKLLLELKENDQHDRRARFVCVMAFADTSGKILRIATGVCLGSIAHQPLGTKGFGYDPVFIPAGFQKSFGELSENVKHRFSHRARATGKINRFLERFSAA